MHHSHERGQALPLTAIGIAFVLIPLLVLGLEVPRWFYIRQNLQIAADAASAAAASQAFDTQLFVNSGDVGYDLTTAEAQAHALFASVTNDAGLTQYSPTITAFVVDEVINTIRVDAEATVQVLIPVAPPVVVRVSSTSQGQVASFPTP